MPENPNLRRATRALIAVRTTTDANDIETRISDLLANVRHLCDAHKLDYGRLDRRGHNAYLGDSEDGRVLNKRAIPELERAVFARPLGAGRKRFNVDVRWHAHATLEVRANNADQARDIARDAGIPWIIGDEADDGDGYEANVLCDTCGATVDHLGLCPDCDED